MALYREVCNLVMVGSARWKTQIKPSRLGPVFVGALWGRRLYLNLAAARAGVRPDEPSERFHLAGLVIWQIERISAGLGKKVAQEGVNAELANRSPETGNTHQSLEEYRDAMLIQLLKLHIVISLVAFVSGLGLRHLCRQCPQRSVRHRARSRRHPDRRIPRQAGRNLRYRTDDRQDIVANDDVYYIRWQDVLAVFSSYVSGMKRAPVAALTEEQVDKLREIMWAMNAVNCSTRAETAVIETTDKNGKETTTEITETVLVIELTHKTPGEMATDYHFTARQNNYLQLLQDPQYEQLWAELLGGFAQWWKTRELDSTRTPTGTLQWPLPVAGTITSQFGHRVDPITGEVSFHTGTDIACAEGTPILAAADGIVTVANGLDSWGGSYGYYIQIDHGTGLETLYAHCSSICVTTGQQAGVIGYVGHTGRATGSHLHFEVRANGNRVNPLQNFL